MNIFKKAILAAGIALACGASLQASAEVISVTNNPSPNEPLSHFSFLYPDTTSFFLDLTKLGATSFDPATDSLLSATLFITLKDDAARDDESWKFTLGQGTKAQTVTGSNIADISQTQCNLRIFGTCVSQSTTYSAGSFTDTLLLNADSLKDLGADGKIKLTIDATSGDFYFDSATLQADVKRGGSAANAVPEPGTVALFGFGLLGALGLRRSRKS